MRLPNGFGSVHKIAGNRRRPYRARITIGWIDTNDLRKKQEFKTIGYYKSKEEGLMALASFKKQPFNLEHKNITFSDVFDMWSIEHFAKIVSSSKRMWLAAYNHSKSLWSLKFNAIKVRDLEDAIQNSKVGPPTKLRMKSLYNMLFKYAIKHEIADKNYALYLDSIKVATKIKRVPFSDDEINMLWQNLNVPFVDMILINIYSGLRPREMVELECKNIDLANGIMRGGIKTLAGKDRVIPIHPKVQSLIATKFCNTSERLFTKEFGQIMTYSDYYNRFKKVMNKFSMSHKPHDARHTFITKAKLYKVDEYVLKLIVGHKIADITENVYTHRNIDELKSEMLKIQ